MMDMTDRIFAVDDITLHDLEDHLNELASDNWVLYSIHNPGTTESALPYFVVIAHRPHDWEASAKKDREKWDAELEAEEKAAAKERLDKLIKEAYKPWTPTGGHANE
jgi:hypothetical protein